ncbi:MAG: peptide deformylase [Firmicutes bacterium]|jgi:peptide deformylase|uniref:Peptide deformylase n=1 Tax=Sulfobacillus benefaciens TaxID=453960 RepID=A0A2T2XAN3_9FIRM|nr:peptide deformylase [Bacillota bacterium]MCL5014456.1 peptide deformylase [Bacillota bacterium]PSR31555.1 MAG: peptide deformylase [Sulfobacillus benefaciens]
MLDILRAEDAKLRQTAAPVRKVNREIRGLLTEMAETMYAAEGIGLAAPQVGISKRVVVADVGSGLVELVNPQILYREGAQLGYEGCLSIPDLVGEVERAQSIRVTGMDRHGHQIWMNCDGLLARCLQHEIDHLDGVLFTDLALVVVERDKISGQGKNEVVLD